MEKVASLVSAGRALWLEGVGALTRLSDRPWMRQAEIDVICEIMRKLAPEACLEWGAGGSTLYFPYLVKNLKKWICVEHDSIWAAKIGAKIADDRVTIRWVAANNEVWSDADSDGSYQDLPAYVDNPRSYGMFDFVLVDGRARTACVGVAREVLNPGGIVVLHDANRVFYDAAMLLFPYRVLLSTARVTSRKGGWGLWIGSDTPIERVLDLQQHTDRWRGLRILEKVGII